MIQNVCTLENRVSTTNHYIAMLITATSVALSCSSQPSQTQVNKQKVCICILPGQIQTSLWSAGTLCLLQILQTASDHPH